MLEILKTLPVAVLFGYALAMIEPYPNTHGLEVHALGALLFLAIAAALRHSQARRAWMLYGLVTFLCFAVPFLWFWVGAMGRGWWYPPQPPIVQRFFFVDGEAAYDAMVANLFLTAWLAATAVFAARSLIRRSRRGAGM